MALECLGRAFLVPEHQHGLFGQLVTSLMQGFSEHFLGSITGSSAPLPFELLSFIQNGLSRVEVDGDALLVHTPATVEMVEIVGQLPCGSYGCIKLGRHGTEEMVIKDVKPKSANQDLLALDFVRECVLHALIDCHHPEFELLEGHAIPRIVPPLKFVGISRDNVPMMAMQMLGDTADEAVARYNNGGEVNKLWGMIIQVIYHVYVLQKHCSFVHRDLHLKNVMSHIVRPAGQLQVEDLTFDIPEMEHFYIVDLGMACATFEGLGSIYPVIDPSQFYDVQAPIFNPAHDLRVFLYSMHYVFHERFTRPCTRVYSFLQSLFGTPAGPYDMYELYKEDDPRFHPLELLRLVKQEM